MSSVSLQTRASPFTPFPSAGLPEADSKSTVVHLNSLRKSKDSCSVALKVIAIAVLVFAGILLFPILIPLVFIAVPICCCIELCPSGARPTESYTQSYARPDLYSGRAVYVSPPPNRISTQQPLSRQSAYETNTRVGGGHVDYRRSDPHSFSRRPSAPKASTQPPLQAHTKAGGGHFSPSASTNTVVGGGHSAPPPSLFSRVNSGSHVGFGSGQHR